MSSSATASNILGLACGREYVLNQRIKSRLGKDSKESLGSLGLIQACQTAEVQALHIYTTAAHSSLYKAASVLGLGRSCIRDIKASDGILTIDIPKLKQCLESGRNNSVSIIAISCGEVNTGLFATYSLEELQDIRALCDEYGAWLHVDGGTLR